MAQEQTKKKSKLKIVLYSIFGFILSFILVMEVSIASQKYIMKSKAPMFLGYGSAIVATESMAGTINPGDMIIFRKVDEYHLGDIITFNDTYIADRSVTHRIVKYGSKEGTFITKGDANATDDKEISEDQIFGKVVLIIPGVGWFTNDPEVGENGWVYFVAVIVIVAGMVYLLKNKPKENKLEDKNDKEEQ